jgi:hypothetical protein
MTYVEELQDMIRHRYGVESTHIESVPITETFEGKTIWEGNVEVFELKNHPKAPKLYAWSYATNDPKRPLHVSVLHVSPISSPIQAVRAAILEESRARELKNPAASSPTSKPDGPESTESKS